MNAIAILLAATINLPPFGEVNVLDTVDCTKTDHDFFEMPKGVSKVETVLGRACRAIPVQAGDEASVFSYRLGKGKGLKPNGSYVVVMDYPDDVPRNYLIVNRATDSHRCFSTGASFGDAYNPAHVDNHLEMVSVPQSGKWEKWICYTSLQDWTADYREGQVSKDNPIRHLPEDGFDFVVGQYSRNHDPVSKGIAVSKILLCEIPDETKCYAKIVYPPAPLPQRHLFWREEMSDGSALQGGKDKRRCADQVDWYRHKCRQMKMLGLNTFQKDLLEFGHVQHWDPNAIRVNWAWSADAESNSLWERTIDMVTKEFGFSILPYYEWFGNMGADFGGKKSYGYRHSCEPLSGEKNFTHVWWTEKSNLDVTDPEALEETKNLFRGSILRFKDRAKFVGALFRTRPAAFPISFSDATRQRFGAEKNGGKAPSRDELRKDRALYAKYLDWWFVKRAAFLDACAKFLRTEGLPEAVVLLDGEVAESGPGLSGGGIVADDPAALAAAFAANGVKAPDKVVPLKDAVAGHRYLKGRAEPCGTWGKWEWQHACPADRPSEFRKSHGAFLAMPVNRLFSVGDPDAFGAYANLDGVTTMIRHHSLNEHNVHCQVNGKGESPIGYDMSDTVKAGRASMMVEVNAMANGDPVNIGYLIGSCFASGFPAARREFNGNFLALPAMKSKVVKGACDDPEVVVREIDCTKTGHGRYYAIVHVGMREKHDVNVRLPGRPAKATFPFYGKSRELNDGVLSFKTLKPWQLLAVHVRSNVKWPDDKLAAFYLSFDDGCLSQPKNVFPLLAQYKVPATFYVCPDWDSFKNNVDLWKAANPYVFLGNHTMTHAVKPTAEAFEKEVADCNAAIRGIRGGDRPVAFGIPGTETMRKLLPNVPDETVDEIFARHRLVLRYPYHGYPVDCKTIPEMEAYVDQVIAEGGIGHMDFHGVGGDWLDPGLEYFTALLKKLDANRDRLWLQDVVTIREYVDKTSI